MEFLKNTKTYDCTLAIGDNKWTHDERNVVMVSNNYRATFKAAGADSYCRYGIYASFKRGSMKTIR